uniref:Uncharacterized protein n=1 Tax=Anguilla anguilla TaxID=7936 RepID=A0A0E9QCT6_ANGAN
MVMTALFVVACFHFFILSVSGHALCEYSFPTLPVLLPDLESFSTSSQDGK